MQCDMPKNKNAVQKSENRGCVIFIWNEAFGMIMTFIYMKMDPWQLRIQPQLIDMLFSTKVLVPSPKMVQKNILFAIRWYRKRHWPWRSAQVNRSKYFWLLDIWNRKPHLIYIPEIVIFPMILFPMILKISKEAGANVSRMKSFPLH